MTDYEIGQDIARRGWFLNPSASAEMQRGYADELTRLAAVERQARQDGQSDHTLHLANR